MATAPSQFAESLKFLKKDIRLGAFVIKHGPIVHRRAHATQAFQSLAEAIIYQQLSGKAAGTILARFIDLFNPVSSKVFKKGRRSSSRSSKSPTSLKLRKVRAFPTPEDVLKIKTEKLRAAGVSGQKAGYLKDLALKFKDGTINPKLFSKMTDVEIIEHVVKVKGVGVWTAQMFLMFTLNRPDVLPTGDLGIQKGFQKLFNLRAKPSPAQMERLSRPWTGHRTLASMYLWRLLDADTPEKSASKK